MKREKIMGCLMIVSSGLIYTFERFLSVFKWSIEIGTGSYPINPRIIGIFDNIFVPILFVMGMLLIIASFISREKE